MLDRLAAALAAIASSVLLTALAFSFAVSRDALSGQLVALLTAFLLYVYQINEYSALARRAERPAWLGWLDFATIATGFLSVMLSIAGV